MASLEAVAEEKGRLEARVAALQGKVDDASAERRRAEHFREVCLNFVFSILPSFLLLVDSVKHVVRIVRLNQQQPSRE